MSVIFDKHDSMSTDECLPQNEQFVEKLRFCSFTISPYLILRASRSASKHQDIVHPNRTLDIPCKNRPLSLPSRTLTRTCITSPAIPCPAHDLDDFGRDYFSSACCLTAHISVSLSIYHFWVAVTPFILLIELTTCSTMC